MTIARFRVGECVAIREPSRFSGERGIIVAAFLHSESGFDDEGRPLSRPPRDWVTYDVEIRDPDTHSPRLAPRRERIGEDELRRLRRR